MAGAAFWGLVSGLSLVIGAVLGAKLRVPSRVLGLLMAFASGVLISSLTFELTGKAFDDAGGLPVTLGLAGGALTFFVGNRLLEHFGAADRKRCSECKKEEGAPNAIVLGLLLDGIPESIVIGLSLTSGDGISLPLVVAVFLSNVPESLSAADGMRKFGYSSWRIVGIWAAAAVASAIAAALGYHFLHAAAASYGATIEAFAAGAILTMLADTLMPEAFEHGGKFTGLVTVLGFAGSFLLSVL